jgi:DNA (cytosine-5)-methyltransferase 1
MGYDARWGLVRASDAGAPHGRARIFIVAYPEGERCGAGEGSATPATGRAVQGTSDSRQLPAYPARGTGRTGQGWDLSESERSAGSTTRACGSATDTDIVGRERAGSARDGRAGSSYSDKPPPDTSGDEGRISDGDSGSPTDASGSGSRAFGPQRPSETGAAARLNGDSEPPTDASGAERGGTESEYLAAASGSTTKLGERAITSTAWGKYGAAINRWERVLGRAAPDPNIVGVNGRPRLNPIFVEWMMGLDLGYVTGHGLRPSQELKALGNGVCPQQAHLALKQILSRAS